MDLPNPRVFCTGLTYIQASLCIYMRKFQCATLIYEPINAHTIYHTLYGYTTGAHGFHAARLCLATLRQR